MRQLLAVIAALLPLLLIGPVQAADAQGTDPGSVVAAFDATRRD